MRSTFAKTALVAIIAFVSTMLVSGCSESTSPNKTVVVEASIIPTDSTSDGSTLAAADISAQDDTISDTTSDFNNVTDVEAGTTTTIDTTADTTADGNTDGSDDADFDINTSDPNVAETNPPDEDVLEQFTAMLEVVADKTIRIRWEPAQGVDYYRVLENTDGQSGFTPISGDLDSTVQKYDHRVALYNKINARYLVQACSADGCLDSEELILSGSLADAVGYFKASNPDERDLFGVSLALSSDGTVLAIGAQGEDSAALGIDGNQTDNASSNAGAVYVFVRINERWQQQAYIKASNADAGDMFGLELCLSGDGNTLAVGASHEDSAATGINGNQSDNTAMNSGAAYVFTQSNGNWQQQAYLKASNTDKNDLFGYHVGCNEDGRTIAVSAVAEQSSASEIYGDQADNSVSDAGAVYVYSLYEGIWGQEAYLKTNVNTEGGMFGAMLGLSADGESLAVSAFDNSNVSTANDTTNDTGTDLTSTVTLFTRLAGVWKQQAYVNSANTQDGGFLDTQLSLSADGGTLAVAAYQDGTSGPGAVYVFNRSDRHDENWLQQARVESSNNELGDKFGGTIFLSGNGDTMLVGAPGEDSSALGIDGEQADNTAIDSGAAYVFKRNNGTWQQQAYLKASNTQSFGRFSQSVGLSSDGNTIAIGAGSENNSAIGVNGNQNGDTLSESGAVYLY